MKKQTTSAAKVAARIDLSSGNRYLVKTTPEQSFKLIMTAIEKGVPVYSEAERHPYDKIYPNILWDTDQLTQTKQGAQHDVSDSVEIVSFNDFMVVIKSYKTNKVKLNDDYQAIVNKDIIRVGCQDIPFAKVKEIVALHKEFYGEAK